MVNKIKCQAWPLGNSSPLLFMIVLVLSACLHTMQYINCNNSELHKKNIVFENENNKILIKINGPFEMQCPS